MRETSTAPLIGWSRAFPATPASPAAIFASVSKGTAAMSGWKSPTRAARGAIAAS
jgi:hypothetical protein